MAGLIASQIALAAVIVGLGVALLSLARQIGVLHERTAPVGGLLRKVGEAKRIDLDAVQAVTANGARASLRRMAGEEPLALLFIAEGCPVCKSLLPSYEEVLRKGGLFSFRGGGWGFNNGAAGRQPRHGQWPHPGRSAISRRPAGACKPQPWRYWTGTERCCEKRASRDRATYSAWPLNMSAILKRIHNELRVATC